VTNKKLRPRKTNKRLFAFLVIIYSLLFSDSTVKPFFFEHKLSNKNFLYQGHSFYNAKNEYTYNYNRFRTELDLGWEENVTFKVIGDVENYLGKSYLSSPDSHAVRAVSFNMPLDPYHYTVSENEQVLRTYFYRAYSTIYIPDRKDTLTLGLQRAAFGVGRIWNPTDILNPVNPISIESGERVGVYGASYIFYISDLSELQAIMTLDRYNNTKDLGARYKTNFYGYDLALSAIRNKDVRMSGLELERELFSTGIAFRTEGCFLENRLADEDYYKYVVGIDYAFENSLYIVAEHLFNGLGSVYKTEYDLTQVNVLADTQIAKHYLGITLSYELTALHILSVSEVQNINDGSYFIAPSVGWSYAQDMDITFGASLFSGSPYSEFSYYQDIYYFSVDNYF